MGRSAMRLAQTGSAARGGSTPRLPRSFAEIVHGTAWPRSSFRRAAIPESDLPPPGPFLGDWTEITRIGEYETPAEEVFGSIRAAALIERGGVVILDGQGARAVGFRRRWRARVTPSAEGGRVLKSSKTHPPSSESPTTPSHSSTEVPAPCSCLLGTRQGRSARDRTPPTAVLAIGRVFDAGPNLHPRWPRRSCGARGRPGRRGPPLLPGERLRG